jgi:membrane protease YdiL (CAAX protease family)
LNEAIPNQAIFGTRVGVLLAAILFSIGHLGNVIYQSLGVTIIQAAGAFFIGYWLGRYYDRTEDLAGAAWLHNVIDGLMFVVPWVFTLG